MPIAKPLRQHAASTTALVLVVAAMSASSANAQSTTVEAPTVPQAAAPAATGGPASVPQATTAVAEPAPPVAAAPATDAIPDIVVTAERRVGNLQTTPISVTALSPAALSEKEVHGIADLQRAAPSLTVNSTGLYANVNIRGVGDSNTGSPNTTSGVAVYRDGLLQPEAVLQGETLFDLADVEVLRGPQGTFVGQNSTGGAVIINSADPELGSLNGRIEAQIGSYKDVRVDGAVNIPMGEDWAARIAFNAERRDSFYDDIAPANRDNFQPGDLSEQDVRVSLLWHPSDAFRSVLKAEFAEIDTDGLTPKPIPGTLYAPLAPADPFTVNYDRLDLKLDQTLARFAWKNDYRFDSGISIRSTTNYEWGQVRRLEDSDASSSPNAYAIGKVGNVEYFGQEVDVLSPDTGRFTWVAGGTYFYRDTPAHLDNYNAAAPFTPAAPFISHVNIATLTKAEGIFGQLSYKLTPKLQLQIGGRYSWQQNQETGTIQAGPTLIPTTGSFTTQVPTGKVALNWSVTPTQFLYAFAARGFKSGGVNNAVSTFANETVNDYEFGWKSTLFDGMLRTQLGGYYMDYRSLQVISIDPLTGRGTLVSNVGNATIKGIEFTAQARLGGVSLDGGIAYNKTALGAIRLIDGSRLPDGGAGTLGPQCAAGQTASCFNYTPYYLNLSGSANTFSPQVTGNVSVSYDVVTGRGKLTPRFSYSHVDKQYATLFQSTGFSLIPARDLVDAQLSYRQDRWTATLYASNLFDETYIIGKSGNNQYYGSPRQFGLRVARTF